MRSKIALVLALALTALCGGVIMAGGNPDIEWSVLAGGGGRVTMAAYALDNTVGQTVAGIASGGPSELCAGFWCMGGVDYRLCLPLVLRQGQ
jgi:hypothetical protein